MNCVTDANGKVLVENDQVNDVWRKYIEKLLNEVCACACAGVYVCVCGGGVYVWGVAGVYVWCVIGAGECSLKNQ